MSDATFTDRCEFLYRSLLAFGCDYWRSQTMFLACQLKLSTFLRQQDEEFDPVQAQHYMGLVNRWGGHVDLLLHTLKLVCEDTGLDYEAVRQKLDLTESQKELKDEDFDDEARRRRDSLLDVWR
jgi:hypothetical protein